MKNINDINLFETIKEVDFLVNQLNLKIFAELEKEYPNEDKHFYPNFYDIIELHNETWDFEIIKTKEKFEDIYLIDGQSYDRTLFSEKYTFVFDKDDGWTIYKNSNMNRKQDFYG